MDSQQTSNRVLGVRYQNISLLTFLQALEFSFVYVFMGMRSFVCTCVRALQKGGSLVGGGDIPQPFKRNN